METLYRDEFSSAHINDRPFDVSSVCSVVPFDLSPEDLLIEACGCAVHVCLSVTHLPLKHNEI